jgi:AraC-like DNA-binding protein
MLPAGEPFHTRTNGSVLWGAIWLPVGRLLEIAASLTGFPLSLPLSPALYKAPATTYRDLRALHGAAFRIAADSPQVLADPEAVHGLEQQIFEAVITSLSEMVENRQTQRMRQNQAIMIAFEHLVQSGPATKISLTEIGRTLRVSEARLRRLGADYLGMSPIAYERLSRLSRARSALLNVNAAQGSAFAMAGDYGFDNVIAFESHYRALFGESPYATLHRRRGI